MSLENKLLAELDVAEQKAWDSLSRYEFQMFGYWAAIWVHLNRLCAKRRNPWGILVHTAKEAVGQHTQRQDCELLHSPYSSLTTCEDEPIELLTDEHTDVTKGE